MDLGGKLCHPPIFLSLFTTPKTMKNNIFFYLIFNFSSSLNSPQYQT